MASPDQWDCRILIVMHNKKIKLNKTFIFCVILLLTFICNQTNADTVQLSEQVNYWIERMDKIDPSSSVYGSAPVNQEAYGELVKIGKPAVTFIIKAIEGKRVTNLNIFLVLRDITEVRIDSGLKSPEGQEKYLNKIKEWMKKVNIEINTKNGITSQSTRPDLPLKNSGKSGG